jgi:hypothetical protein
VNCYGQHAIARRGGLARRFADIDTEELDPIGPTPARCMQLGPTSRGHCAARTAGSP